MPNYLVKPREPTVLSHKEYHELSSTNLLLVAIPTVHVIPDLLDVERFNVALSEALSSFPLLAGRLVKPNTPDAPWKIRLTNSGVPVSFIDSDADEIFPTDLTAQYSPCLVEPLNGAGITNAGGESDEPLFRLTITRFTKLNSTSVGAFRSHVLFDVSGHLLFFRLLSQLYQGLAALDPPPYYEPEAIKFTESPETSHPTFSREDPLAPSWQRPERMAMEFVAFRLTATQLTEMHSTVAKGMEHLRMSRVDPVVGLLARCLSEVEPESKPIDTISYVVNHRGMGIYPESAALNAIFWVSSGIPASKGADPCEGVLAWAVGIRKSLGRLKDPGFVKNMAASLAKMLSQDAWYNGVQDTVAAEEGCLIVNNTWKFAQTSPHFGHPGKTMFYAGHPPGSRFVKVVPPNPRFVDGAWVSREGEMEVTLYVPPNRRKRFEELFEGYAQSLGMTGSVEFVP